VTPFSRGLLTFKNSLYPSMDWQKRSLYFFLLYKIFTLH
jgi:hypothetical protein